MQAPYRLASDVTWCDAQFGLYTPEPKSDDYHFLCPACKRTHAFQVLERRSTPN